MRAAQRARDGNVVAAKPREVALQRCPRRLSAHVRRRRRRQRAVRDADGRKRKHRRRGVGADSGTWKDKRRTDAQRQPAAAGTALGGRVVADTVTAGHEECLTAAAGREEPCKRGRTGAVAAGDVVACDCDEERRGGVSAVVDVCRAAQPHDRGRVCAGGVGARRRHGVAVDGESTRHGVVHRRSPTVRLLANCTPSPPPRSRLAATVTAAPDRSVGARKKMWARCTAVLFGAVTSLPENSKSEQPPSSTDAAVPRATTPVRSCPVATMLQRRTLKDARMSSTKRPKTVTAAASAGPSVRGFHKAAIIDCSLRLSISGPAVLNAVWCTVTDEGLADRSSPPSTRIALPQSC